MLDSPDHWSLSDLEAETRERNPGWTHPVGPEPTTGEFSPIAEPVAVYCDAHPALDITTHNDLRAAYALIQGVLSRERIRMNNTAIECLCDVKRIIDIAEKYMGGDPTA